VGSDAPGSQPADWRADSSLSLRLNALAAKGSGARGRDVLWATASRIGSQALQFIALLVLARLLDPRAFGIVAVAQVFTGFANLFSDLGLGAALVHTKELNRDLVTTAFYANLIMGVALAILIGALSIPLAAAYHSPQLEPILWIAGLQIAVNVTIVPLAILERSFRFKRLAAIELSAAAVSVATSVGMAAAGFGPVSLVTGNVVAFALEGAVLWGTVRISPRGQMTRREARRLWDFSGPLVVLNSLLYWARNIDNLVLGIVAGSLALGLYTRAYALMLIPVQQVSVVLGRVLLATLSRRKDEASDLRPTYLRALRLSAAVTLPLGVGLACLAGPLVAVVFGAKWRGMATMLAILASTTPVQVTVATTGPIYQALGETSKWRRRSGFGAVLTMAALCVGAAWGGVGVSIAWAAASFLLFRYFVSQPWSMIGLSVRSGLAAVAPQVGASLLMGAWLFALDRLTANWPQSDRLLVCALSGAGVYLGVVSLFDNRLAIDWIAAVRGTRHHTG
jgi:O-antigen/teichoic acid export membrane protein